MKKLLLLEFIKYSRSRIFYVITGLYLAIIILLELFPGSKSVVTTNGFPDVWQNLTYSVSFMNFLLGLIVIFSITSDYQYKTLRQHIVDGFSRINYFFAKNLYALCLVIFTTLFVFVSILIIGITKTAAGNTHSMFEGTAIIFDYFIQLLGYLSLAVFMGLLFRNTALSVIIYMLYVLIIEGGVAWAIFHTETNIKYTAYFPKTLFSTLVEPNKIYKIVGTPIMGLVNGAPDHETRLILTGVYILIFSAGSFLLLKKRDL